MDRLLSHLLDRPRDRNVFLLPALVLPGVLLTDGLTGQRNDLATGHRAELRRMATSIEISEALEAPAQEPRSPALDSLDGNPQSCPDRAGATPSGAGQDDPSPCRVT